MGSSDEPTGHRRRLLILLACMVVVLFGASALFIGLYRDYRDWNNSKAAPLFSDIEPADGATVYASDAWVHWKSPVSAKGRVLWRKAGGSRINSADAGNSQELLAHLSSLNAGSKYEYIVEENDGTQTLRTPVRTLSVKSGLAFDPVIEQTVERDYDQTVKLTLHNRGTQPVTVSAKALKQYGDLPSDITGYGSVDLPATIAPNSTQDLRLAVTAADATADTYEIPIEAAGAYVDAKFHVRRPKFDVAFRVLVEDPKTLAKMIEIQNNGDTLTDLSVRAAQDNEADLTFEPAIEHLQIYPHEGVRFTVSPVLYLEFESLNAAIEAHATGQTAKFSLDFKAPTGMHLIAVRSDPTSTANVNGHVCTNDPSTCSASRGLAGNGIQGEALTQGSSNPEPGECDPPKCNLDDMCKTLKALLDLINSQVDVRNQPGTTVNEHLTFNQFVSKLDPLLRRLDVDLACRLNKGVNPGIEQNLEQIHRDRYFKSLSSYGYETVPNSADCGRGHPDPESNLRCADYNALDNMRSVIQGLATANCAKTPGKGAESPCPETGAIENAKTQFERAGNITKFLKQISRKNDPELDDAFDQLLEGLEDMTGFLEKLIKAGKTCEEISKILGEIRDLLKAIQEINGAGCNSQKLAQGFDDLTRAAGQLAGNLPIPDPELQAIVDMFAQNSSFFSTTGCALNPECRWNKEFANVDGYIPNCPE